jgi:hypothetical protein
MAALVSLTFLSLFSLALHGQPLPERRVSIHAEDVRLSRALDLIAKEGRFKLSYNAAVVPVDSIVTLHVTDRPVDRVLHDLLPPHVSWKSSGHHLIITGRTNGVEHFFTTTGRVLDGTTGAAIAWASVLEVQRGQAVHTSNTGDFRITLAGDLERTPVRIARHGYRDTVLHVSRHAQVGPIALQPVDQLDRLEPLCDFDRCGVEELGMARLLVPTAQLEQALNLGYAERRFAQFALIPTVSTNGPLAGATVNRASFNLLGGYARGVDGVEVGAGVNILADAMNGFQFGGMANLVGGHMRGAQVAGGVNHTMRSVHGLQLAGLSNTVWDTLSGAQVAGGVNVVKRGMTGTQVAGAVNVTLGDLDGVQVAGGVNLAHGVVHRSQVAGALNYAKGVEGGQVAGAVNVSLGPVRGGQVGFAANYAPSVSGGQVSFGMNVVPGEVSGGQVGFGMNYAHHVSGGQFTFGANIVPGTVEGGQVGVLNFAMKAVGGQVGILNLSDTVSGGAVGILTISRKGYHRFDLVYNDVFPLSLQVRTGTRVFHNILGYSPALRSDGRWGFLYGIGFEPRVSERGFVNIDLTAEQVVEQREWVDAVNILGRLAPNFGQLYAGRITVTAGPVLNVLVSDLRDPDTGAYISTLPPSDPAFTGSVDVWRISGWLGWKAGVGVRF